MIKNKPVILYYDIETTPLKAYIWRLGEQVVRHDQLCDSRTMYDIICITYCFNDGKPAKSLSWGYSKQNSKDMIAKFDEIVNTADIIIGKNNKRFDNKHINMQRMLHGLDSNHSWLHKMEDLETQMRKHFNLPSNSLDYISELLGLGGKIKMCLNDWVDIVEKKNFDSYKKMIEYGKKDIEDTRAVWEYCEKYFTPRYNTSVIIGNEGGCVHCGSSNLKKNGMTYVGGTVYQTMYCKDHKGYAGRISVTQLEKGNEKLKR